MHLSSSYTKKYKSAMQDLGLPEASQAVRREYFSRIVNGALGGQAYGDPLPDIIVDLLMLTPKFSLYEPVL